jgi:SAM-dependent methyltransferase
MTDERTPPVVASRYEELIDRGVYSASFVHAGPERHLVDAVLRPIISALRGPDARLLDAGCGPGAWLEGVAHLADELGVAPRLFAFDLTPGMVELTAERLGERPVPVTVKVGDALDPAAYRFDGVTDFELVYAFDLVQQLPKSAQLRAVETMLGAVAPGGTLVVFDHDKDSRYGRKMGLKKWLTRHTPIGLVPAYYIESAYPPLAAFAKELGRRPGIRAEVRQVPESPKRAMILRKVPAGAAASG